MRTHKIKVIIKAFNTLGAYGLSEIKGLTEGTRIEGRRIEGTNTVIFKWFGVDACLQINSNCYEERKPKAQRIRYYQINFLRSGFCYRTTMDVPHTKIKDYKDTAKALGEEIEIKYLYTRTIK